MTDFTQKGTKLPIIPIGTKFKWLKNGEFKEPCESNQRGTYKHSDFISFGIYVHKNKKYVICENQEAYTYHLRFLIKLSTIKRLAKEQGMCDTNNEQMKTQVTLNDNGDVTVTENNTTTIHSKETALQIYEVVKADLGKHKLEIGKWYVNHWGAKYVFQGFGVDTYGFDINNKFITIKAAWSDSIQDWQPVPTETVQTALRKEAIKRGFLKGVKFHSLNKQWEIYENISIYKINNTDFVYDPIENSLDYQEKGDWQKHRVFANGKWAAIIQPETISIQEAEKRTGCVVDKNL